MIPFSLCSGPVAEEMSEVFSRQRQYAVTVYRRLGISDSKLGHDGDEMSEIVDRVSSAETLELSRFQWTSPNAVLTLMMISKKVPSHCEIVVTDDACKPKKQVLQAASIRVLSDLWKHYANGDLKGLLTKSELITEWEVLKVLKVFLGAWLARYSNFNASNSTIDTLLLKPLSSDQATQLSQVVASAWSEFCWLPELWLLCRLNSVISQFVEWNQVPGFSDWIRLPTESVAHQLKQHFLTFDCPTHQLGNVFLRPTLSSPETLSIHGQSYVFWR